MDDLIAEFLTETNESLDALDVDLVKLERDPNDKELLSQIFRVIHTIKGTCGFIGLSRLENVAHKAEDVLGLFRDGELDVTPEYVTIIFDSLDRIKYIVGEIEATGKEPKGEDNELLANLDQVLQKGGHKSAEKEDVEKAFSGDDAAAIKSENVDPPPPLETDTEPKTRESALSSQSLRVNVDVLENLMTMVSELVLTRNQLLQIARSSDDDSFTAPLQRLNHVVSDLQEGVMKTRMQPIGNAWGKLPRIIRDICTELEKKIDLEMKGQETELDRQVLELIKAPLTHMVRNSADHGIETPADRVAAGKPDTGHISLNSYHEGGHIIIEIADDGRGLSTAKIKEKILNKGIATSEELEMLSTQQIQQFIFKPGFSTAEKITPVSGRGVGMDVVRTNIEKIGGSIDLQSVEGEGTTIQIKIPLTLAIVSALIVESGRERFAIPQLAVKELVMTSADGEDRIETIKGTPVFRLRDNLLPLISLQELLKIVSPHGTAPSETNEGDKKSNRYTGKYIVVTQVGSYQFGVIVDKVFDTEEIVVKPVAHMLHNIEMFSGNTILGDGTVIMILDPAGIAKSSSGIEMAERTDNAPPQDDDARASKQPALDANGGVSDSKKVLLVEDSPFFRNMLAPLLKAAGYEVTTADNAMDALALCDDGYHFDIILSDIEMPEMSGLEFAEALRRQDKWQNIPLVALSSHASEQDIHKGMEAGFHHYIAKFDRDRLLDTLSQTFENGNGLDKTYGDAG